MGKVEKPLGVSILGGFNFFVLGLISLFSAFFVYLNIYSPSNEAVLEGSGQTAFSSTGQLVYEEFKKYLPEETLNVAQFKAIIILQIIISVFFSIFGAGLILKKEWARRGTIYFSFLIVVIEFLLALMNPGLVKQAIFQIIYPGILIVYFTNKKIEGYFISPSK